MEQRLKQGDLKAIVATASLELGIDIGSLDHVILVQSPPSISSAVQRIGELDEEFVWEAKKGQVFTLGTQNWRIHRITHNDVFVRPARSKAPAPPFWRAGDADRDFYLSDKIARLLEAVQYYPDDSATMDELTSRYHMDGHGAHFLLLPEVLIGDRDTTDIMTLVSSTDVESLLRQRLEGSGVFGARFRECAARALLLPRRNFKQRMPLWLTRQKSQKLLDALGRFADFPILLETWRTCLQDDFDMAALVRVLRELEKGQISWSEVHTASPSPMALSGSWRQINQYMYADDRQPGRVKTDLSPDLLQQVVFTPDLRPAVDAAIVTDFQEKRQRLHPGYAPDSAVELLEWVKERLLLPAVEWERLIERAVTDSGLSRNELLDPIREKLLRLFPGAAVDIVSLCSTTC